MKLLITGGCGFIGSAVVRHLIATTDWQIANIDKLKAKAPNHDFDFVVRQRGMFSYSGLTKDQVTRLREEFSVYAIDTGRICVAALNSGNIDYVVGAVAKVIA